MVEIAVSKSRKLKLGMKIAACIALAATAGVLSLYFSHFPSTFSGNQGEWGQFGDYVGGLLNPFFSVLGFFALLYTIQQQSEVIDIQRIEMARSTAELEKSAAALKEQNSHYERQQFDARLFHLMSLHSETVSRVKVVHYSDAVEDSDGWLEPSEYQGALALHFVFLVLMDDSLSGVRRRQGVQTVKDMEDAYARWKALYSAPLSKYFGSIKNIVRFISSSTVDIDSFSVELLRSQMSDEEQRLLVYVCALDETMRPALRFLSDNRFGGALAAKDSFSYDLAQLVSYRLHGSFISSDDLQA